MTATRGYPRLCGQEGTGRPGAGLCPLRASPLLAHRGPLTPSFEKIARGKGQGSLCRGSQVAGGLRPGAADSGPLHPASSAVCQVGWAQSRASPRGSVSLGSWGGSEAQGPGPAPNSGTSTICSGGAEVEQGHGGGRAWAQLSPSSCGLPAWPGSAEQGQGGGGAWPRTRARVTGQLPEELPGVHTLSNFLWL